MFVGHYAAAFAAKAIEPKAPLWTLVAGAQLVDIGWSALIIAGIERASVDPALPGSSLILEHMPWTHSLPMTFVWAAGAALLARFVLRLTNWASVMIGITVASHWLLDFLVHRPDLELWIGGDKVGLGLWNYPVPEQALEMGLLAVCGAAWAASRKAEGRTAWPALVFIGFLVALQVIAMLAPTPAGPAGFQVGLMALTVYLAVTGIAALTEPRNK